MSVRIYRSQLRAESTRGALVAPLSTDFLGTVEISLNSFMEKLICPSPVNRKCLVDGFGRELCNSIRGHLYEDKRVAYGWL
jgi:hypothetical protein